jgi:hypothetical protein
MINNYLGCVSVAIMVATPLILLWIISAVTPQPATLPIQSKLLHKPLFDGKGKRLITPATSAKVATQSWKSEDLDPTIDYSNQRFTELQETAFKEIPKLLERTQEPDV